MGGHDEFAVRDPKSAMGTAVTDGGSVRKDAPD
jgi:hypothetical protein